MRARACERGEAAAGCGGGRGACNLFTAARAAEADGPGPPGHACVRRSALMGYCLVHARVLGPAGPASRRGGGAGEVEAGGGGDREAQERRHPPRAPPASRRPEEEANLRAAGPGSRWRRENFNRLLGEPEKENIAKAKGKKKSKRQKSACVWGFLGPEPHDPI